MSDATTCPTCGRTFDTNHGVSIHHRSHGEPLPLEWRFWSKVDVRGPDECWQWQASTDAAGYGQFYLGAFGTNARAHRVSLVLAGAEIAILADNPGASGVLGLHSCDNRRCVNPNHLYVGTNGDVIAARADRDWSPPPGESNPVALLTNEEVVDIRERYEAGGVTYLDLADDYGVCESAIANMVNGETYTDAGGPVIGDDYDVRYDDSEFRGKITKADVSDIRERYASGEVNQSEIAADYPIDRGTVGSIVRGDTWPDAPGPIKGVDYE